MKNGVFIFRVGLIRFSTSILVILLAGVLNRIIISDLGVTASIVTIIFSVQHVVSPIGIVSGHWSDTRPWRGYRRSPYILGGMGLSILVMPFFPALAKFLSSTQASWFAIALNVVFYGLFGLGATISATALNSLIVDAVPKEDRGQAMGIVWIMTLAGFLVGSVVFLKLIPEYNEQVLQTTFTWVPVLTMIMTAAGLWGVEKKQTTTPDSKTRPKLRAAFRSIKNNRMAAYFFLFLAASNFFFFLQEYLLEAFGGEVLKFSVSETTGFNFYWSYGVIAGMAGISALAYIMEWMNGKFILGVSLVAGALAFLVLTGASVFHLDAIVSNGVLIMGLAKGIYNIGLSYLTMTLVDEHNSGFFMGLWNFMSGLAIAFGEMVGGPIKDLVQHLTSDAGLGYAMVFLIEALGLLACLLIIKKIDEKAYWRYYEDKYEPSAARA